LAESIAKLALDDGTVFRGDSVGADAIAEGEVVFNTSLFGYQEIFTDPSYNGQMVVMTNPLIGNYGINVDDEESSRPFVRGVIVREISRRPSSFRSQGDLQSYLRKHGIPGIAGIDTRAVTKLLRVTGFKKGVLAAGDPGSKELDDDILVDRARAWPGLGGRDMVAEVSCKEPLVWDQGFNSPFSSCYSRAGGDATRARGEGPRVVAYDFGIKRNILRILYEMGFVLHVVPATTTAEEVRALKPDGVFLSNGPGDPEGLPYAVEAVRALVEEYPTFGICLGHQLTALALGARTTKLKFGHHGGNHPVKNLLTGKVEISVQNHCYAVEADSLGADLQPSFVNLNDQTLEGLFHKELPVFTVQFHPEAAPGPTDFTFLFRQFETIVREKRPVALSRL
jgi:carbamoyl-phosphate synthase small subunit